MATYTVKYMQNHYRDKFDIIVSILDVANGNEIIQADIFTKANISSYLIQEISVLTTSI